MKTRIALVMAMLLAFMGSYQKTQAKSVFVVPAHSGIAIKAYLIDPNGVLTLQATIESQGFVERAAERQ